MFSIQRVTIKHAEAVFTKIPEAKLPESCQRLKKENTTILVLTHRVFHAADHKSHFLKAAYQVSVVALSVLTVLPLFVLFLDAIVGKIRFCLHNKNVPSHLKNYKKEFIADYMHRFHKRLHVMGGVVLGTAVAVTGALVGRSLIVSHNVKLAAAKAAADAAKAAANAATIVTKETSQPLREILNEKHILSNKQVLQVGGIVAGISVAAGTVIGLTFRCITTGACKPLGKLAVAIGKPIGKAIAWPFNSKKKLCISIPTITVASLAYPAYKLGSTLLKK
ncbi:MAG: hypothetical protein WCP39_04430 [Chlamydiota bacterium]